MHKNITEECVTFSENDGKYLAIAELSRMSSDLNEIESAIGYVFVNKKPLFYFNRLNVPFNYADKSVVHRLMKEVVEWADEQQYNILDNLNPYGRADLKTLIKLNKIYGFKLINQTSMVRECKND